MKMKNINFYHKTPHGVHNFQYQTYVVELGAIQAMSEYFLVKRDYNQIRSFGSTPTFC